MEASVVVCEPLKPPCFCHTENQPEVHKTATQKRARGARAVLCAVRAVCLFPSEGGGHSSTTRHSRKHSLTPSPLILFITQQTCRHATHCPILVLYHPHHHRTRSAVKRSGPLRAQKTGGGWCGIGAPVTEP